MTTAPAPKSPTERILRECDCPPWVLNCSHFDGEVIILAGPPSRELGLGLHLQDCPVRLRDQSNWWVLSAEAIAACPLCGQPKTSVHRPAAHCVTDDYDEALAAFYAAEARLLRGEE